MRVMPAADLVLGFIASLWGDGVSLPAIGTYQDQPWCAKVCTSSAHHGWSLRIECLACGEAGGVRWQPISAAEQLEAAVGLDREAGDTVGAAHPHIQVLAVMAQRHVGRVEAGRCGDPIGVQQRDAAILIDAKARDRAAAAS